MKRWYNYTVVLILATTCVAENIPYEAVISVPYANLVGTPYGNEEYTNYTQLPFEGIKGISKCNRLHQLLFNERIQVVGKRGKQLRVKIYHAFYLNAAGTHNCSTLWMHSNDCIPITQLTKKECAHALPEPINYRKKAPDNTKTATLIQPYHDAAHNRTFSVGTRFIIKNKVEDVITVYALNPDTLTVSELSVKKSTCMTSHPQTEEDIRSQFIDIARQYAHLPKGFIPYVWGGTSFSTPYLSSSITRNDKYFTGTQSATQPLNGFDCTGLVLRIAQLCGMRFFYKNSRTMAHYLTPITTYKALKNGDLMWFSGHIMIVSDKKNNMIIEARNHEHGFGKVHETHIKNIFHNIATLEDLFTNNRNLQRLDSSGKTVQNIHSIKFLNLVS